MKKAQPVPRREMRALTGMALGFRSLFAMVVDGEGTLNAGWVSILLGALMALPVLAVSALTEGRRAKRAKESPEKGGGQWVWRTMGFLVLLTALYDGAASIRILCTAGRYMALSDASLPVVMFVTVLAGGVGVSMGASATAGAAVLWRKLAAGLIVLLVATQASQLHPAWLTPVLGPGWPSIARNALPVAGMLVLAAPAGFLVEKDKKGRGISMIKTAMGAAIVASLAAVALSMLSPAMWQEMPQRAFRIEHMLVNDRAGLSLELPYVILVFGGMTTVMLFELTLAVWMMRSLFPSLSQGWASAIAGCVAFLLLLLGLSEGDAVRRVSAWYYPALGAPIMLIWASDALRVRGKSKSEERGG